MESVISLKESSGICFSSLHWEQEIQEGLVIILALPFVWLWFTVETTRTMAGVLMCASRQSRAVGNRAGPPMKRMAPLPIQILSRERCRCVHVLEFSIWYSLSASLSQSQTQNNLWREMSVAFNLGVTMHPPMGYKHAEHKAGTFTGHINTFYRLT